MSTLELLQDILIREYSLARAQLAPEAKLADLGVDSLGLIELMFQIEDQFHISLPEDKPPALVTIGDVETYIDNLVNPPAAVPHDTGAAVPLAN
jgi:acyl carrier protein